MYCNKCGNELEKGEKFCSKCGNKVEVEEKNRKRNIVVSCIIMLLIVPIITVAIIMNSTKTERSLYSNNGNYKESTKNINIDEESKNNIKKLYNKISGYGNSNIIKAIYWKLADGTPAIKIAYSNTNRNGMYITVDRKVYVEYGDEESLYKGSGQNKRQSNELFFTMYKDSKENIFLTGDEFRSIIK